jgi:hypothetical protein
MPRVEFRTPPTGDEIDNPDRRMLRELVLYGGAGYWSAGCGQGALNFFRSGQRRRAAQLLLMSDESAGFYLEHVDEENGYHVSVGGDDFEHEILVYVGGDPIRVPPALFVTPEAAWTAVEEFCKTGRRTRAITWKLRDALDWEYSTEL